MGRPPLFPGEYLPRLTPQQREMLALTVEADRCTITEPSIAATTWSVRTGPGGGVERDFYDTVGDALVRLGLIEPDYRDEIPRVRSRRDEPAAIVPHRPTNRGVALVEIWRVEGRYRAMGMALVIKRRTRTQRVAA